MLTIQDLSFSYGMRQVLSHINLTANEGELIFLLGANGAGKTTLFRCMLGILRDHQGRILIDGEDTATMPERQLASQIAYIPQSHDPNFSYSVLDMVLMGTNHRLDMFSSPGIKEKNIAMDALQQLGLEDYAYRNYHQLSGGEQQLVLVARALAQQAKILLMDEPTSALDFGNQLRVLDRIVHLASQGYTVILSCHSPQQALTYAGRIVAMCDGAIVADGKPDEVLNESLMRRLYGVATKFVSTEEGMFIAPRRKSLGFWSEDMIRFMRVADEHNCFFDKIAQEIVSIVPERGHICDAGCGIGSLSLALSRDFAHVTATDASPAALDALRRRNPPENLTIRRCDVLTDTPKSRYDAMVFCRFGSTQEILRTARAQCEGTVVVIKRTWNTHRFTPGDKAIHARYGFDDMKQYMDKIGVPYQCREAIYDMGQPLRSLKEAVSFFDTYKKDSLPSMTEEEVANKLERREDIEFPYYLPSDNRVGILWFDAKDIPELVEENTNSYGAIVFRDDKVLMIRSAGGWSFPKGHREAGESPTDTALREVREETSVKAKLDACFEREVPSAKPTDHRTVTFYAASYISGTVRAQEAETPEAAWQPVSLAAELIRYEPDRRAYLDALAYWRGRSEHGEDTSE